MVRESRVSVASSARWRGSDNKAAASRRRRRRTSGRTTPAESCRSTSLAPSDQQLGNELHFSEPVDPTWQRGEKKRTGMRKVTAVVAVWVPTTMFGQPTKCSLENDITKTLIWLVDVKSSCPER